MGYVFFILFFAYRTCMAATPTPIPNPGNFPEANGFLQFTRQPAEDAATYRMIDQQNKFQESGVHSSMAYQEHIASGEARARQMVEMLKDQEMQKALQKVTAQGKQMLQENPELKNPITIVAGAVSLWAGRTIRLMKSETFKLSTHVEGRARSGDFSLESPILNGKLAFTGNDGFSVSMNRSIASSGTSAAFGYSAKQQSFTGQITHPLSKNIDLSFGASQLQQSNQTDGQAKLEYRLSF